VLAPGGWALTMVPIGRYVSYEDPTVTGTRERQAVFGQHDHVRVYGYDVQDRLEDAGFEVEESRPARHRFDAERFGLHGDDIVHWCQRA
jgi:hypothetical protein